MNRRELISLSVAGWAALAARRAGAIGERARFRFGDLRLADAGDNPRPTSLRRLAWEVDKRTSIDIEIEAKPVRLTDRNLHDTPFLVLVGDREFPLPSGDELDTLRAFLTFGGFLLIDSAEGRLEGAFDRSVRKLVSALFPSPAPGLEIIPSDHVPYKSFYLIDRPRGRVAVSPVLEGVTHDDRLAIVYTQNDLAGAWSRDNFGNWEFRCEPDGERQRERTFRLGINLVMYSLCLEYKSDQVHVPFIMRRRRWRPGEP